MPLTMGLLAGGGGKIATINYETVVGTNTGNTTFTGVDFGTPDPSRHIIAVPQNRAAASRSLVGITIGGVTATIVGTDTSGLNNSGLVFAKVPDGATGTIIVSWSGSVNRTTVGVWSVTGVDSLVSYGFRNSAGTLLVPVGGGVVIGGMSGYSGSSTITGAARDYNIATGTNGWTGGHQNIPDGNAALSIDVTWSSTLNKTIVAASFGAA